VILHLLSSFYCIFLLCVLLTPDGKDVISVLVITQSETSNTQSLFPISNVFPSTGWDDSRGIHTNIVSSEVVERFKSSHTHATKKTEVLFELTEAFSTPVS
jgi:hypothetical protein